MLPNLLSKNTLIFEYGYELIKPLANKIFEFKQWLSKNKYKIDTWEITT